MIGGRFDVEGEEDEIGIEEDSKGGGVERGKM